MDTTMCSFWQEGYSFDTSHETRVATWHRPSVLKAQHSGYFIVLFNKSGIDGMKNLCTCRKFRKKAIKLKSIYKLFSFQVPNNNYQSSNFAMWVLSSSWMEEYFTLLGFFIIGFSLLSEIYFICERLCHWIEG